MTPRHGPHPMMTMWGAFTVSFSIDPEAPSRKDKERLVNAGASFQVAFESGQGIGPVFPLPRDWIVFSSLGRRETVDLRDSVTVHNWPGPSGFYDRALIRVADGRTFMLVFDRARFGPLYRTRINPRLMQENTQ